MYPSTAGAWAGIYRSPSPQSRPSSRSVADDVKLGVSVFDGAADATSLPSSHSGTRADRGWHHSYAQEQELVFHQDTIC